MKQKKRKIFQIRKNKNYDDLFELVNTFNKKEEYKYHAYDDLDYYGLRDKENLIDNDNSDDYDQYQSKVLLKMVINIMKAEVIKPYNYQ